MKATADAAGILLRIERLRQKKGQKEVCYGICTVSYLSKIEHGRAHCEPSLLAALYGRLGIAYESDADFLRRGERLLRQYYENMLYNTDNRALWRELCALEGRLMASSLATDYMLVCCLQDSEKVSGLLPVLEQLGDCMTPFQNALLCMVQTALEPKPQRRLELCRSIYDALHNTLGMRYLLGEYYTLGEYNAIHRMERQLTAAAIEEGNVYALAYYFFLNATAYSCMDMDDMMAVYYERACHILKNTVWWKQYRDTIYYNMGATYLNTGKYELAKQYLWQVKEETFLLWHKKARLSILLGDSANTELYLAKMKEALHAQTFSESYQLMYEELCMETKPDYAASPAYLELLERLFSALRREQTFGFLYQYKDAALRAYTLQRQYKKALQLQNELSGDRSKTVL